MKNKQLLGSLLLSAAALCLSGSVFAQISGVVNNNTQQHDETANILGRWVFEDMNRADGLSLVAKERVLKFADINMLPALKESAVLRLSVDGDDASMFPVEDLRFMKSAESLSHLSSPTFALLTGNLELANLLTKDLGEGSFEKVLLEIDQIDALGGLTGNDTANAPVVYFYSVPAVLSYRIANMRIGD